MSPLDPLESGLVWIAAHGVHPKVGISNHAHSQYLINTSVPKVAPDNPSGLRRHGVLTPRDRSENFRSSTVLFKQIGDMISIGVE